MSPGNPRHKRRNSGHCTKKYRITMIRECVCRMMSHYYCATITGEIFANFQNLPINQEAAVMEFIIISIMWADQGIINGSTQTILQECGSKCTWPMNTE